LDALHDGHAETEEALTHEHDYDGDALRGFGNAFVLTTVFWLVIGAVVFEAGYFSGHAPTPSTLLSASRDLRDSKLSMP